MGTSNVLIPIQQCGTHHCFTGNADENVSQLQTGEHSISNFKKE